MILTNSLKPINEIGGKAYNLLCLNVKNTPPLFVCPASYFKAAALNGSLKNQLKTEIENVFSDKKLYAVRSSAIDEDSASDSFAGVHDSFLNVNKKDILYYIEKVYESAFTERAVAYRKTKGISAELENISVAVVIQEMIDADFAGVINTINPVTDNPDEIVISVTRGLGDKIVDGSESGTTYTVNNGDVKIEGEDILSRRLLKKIIELANEVAEKTTSFQDIEFACRRGKVYFLQARAITTYGDINPHKRNLIIDNSNIIESFFGVTSPLTFTFARDVYKEVYCTAMKRWKIRKKIYDEVSPALADMLYYYEGKIYYNMNSWYHGLSVFPDKKTFSYFENMIGANSKTREGKSVKMNIFDVIKFAAATVANISKIERLADSFEEKFERTVMPYYNKKLTGTNEYLLSVAYKIEEDIIGEFVIPVINDCAVMYYFGKLRDKAEKLNISAEEMNKYISNEGNVKSADSAMKLVELVEAVKSDDKIYEDFLSLDEETLAEKYRNGTPVSQKLNEYIRLFGARVIDELKLETVTMIEDEKLLYRLVKENLALNYVKPKNEICQVHNKLKKLAEKAKKYMRLRERLRLKRTYAYSVLRNVFLAMGENYYNSGRLENARDIFYLTKSEVISGEGDFLYLVKKRKAEERVYLSKPTYDRIVFFDGKPLFVKQDQKNGELHGIPSGNGTVTAKVSLMQSPEDKLTAGNIILTKRTDPGWISLFPLAGGLIVEYGSMLSHSFVVARELNLPAVVGLKNATSLIPNGATVFLDGLHGEVKIINEDNK